jgi:hypothetical protein
MKDSRNLIPISNESLLATCRRLSADQGGSMVWRTGAPRRGSSQRADALDVWMTQRAQVALQSPA